MPILETLGTVAGIGSSLAGIAGSFGLGGGSGGDGYQPVSGPRQMQFNAKQQRQFAKRGIQWRVRDAKKAGLHPLAALGANSLSFNPVVVGQGGGSSGYGSPLSDLSQNLSNVESRVQNYQQREFTKELQETQLKNAKTDAERAEVQLAMDRMELSKMTQPPLPQTEERVISPTRMASHKGDRPTAAGTMPTRQLADIEGGFRVVPSEPFKQVSEDQVAVELPWIWDNYIKSLLGGKPPQINMNDIKKRYPHATGYDYEPWSGKIKPTFGLGGKELPKEGWMRRYHKKKSNDKYNPEEVFGRFWKWLFNK